MVEPQMLTVNKPQYNPFLPYEETVRKGIEGALNRFWDKPEMDARSAELISDGVIQLMLNEAKKKTKKPEKEIEGIRKNAQRERKNRYKDFVQETLEENKKYKSEDDLPQDIKDHLWKKACISVVGDLLDLTNKYMPLEGQRIGIGILGGVCFDNNGDPIELVSPELMQSLAYKIHHSTAGINDIADEEAVD